MRREFEGTTVGRSGSFLLVLVTTSLEAHQDFLAAVPAHLDLYLKVCGQLLQQLPVGDAEWRAVTEKR